MCSAGRRVRFGLARRFAGWLVVGVSAMGLAAGVLAAAAGPMMSGSGTATIRNESLGSGSLATTGALTPTEAYTRVAVWRSDPAPPPQGFFLNPHGLAADPFDASVWVADSDNDRIQHLAADGRALGVVGGPGPLPAGLRDPRDVAVQGSLLFVADYGHNRVALFDDSGAYRGEWTDLAGPWGIVAGDDGRVFVALNQSSQIAVFQTSGRRLATWGGLGEGFGQLNRPQGLGLSADGRLFIADGGNGQVKVFDPATGQQVRETKPDPFAPVDLALDPLGDLYVLYADGVVRRHLDTTGLPADPNGQIIRGGAGIAAGIDNAIIVSFQDDDRPKSGIVRFTGRPLVQTAEWGGVPAPLGRLVGPTRLAASTAGLWVADSLRRAQRFDAAGQATSQIGTGPLNDIVPLPSGGLAVVRDRAVLGLDAAGRPTWSFTPTAQAGPFRWLVAGAAEPQGALAVIDLGEQRLARISAAGLPVGGFVFGDPTSPPAALPLWDLATTSAGYAMVNRRSAEVEVRRTDNGTLIRRWTVPGEPLRLAGDGTTALVVLNRRGWVWKYALDGSLLAVWQTGDPTQAESAPSDLTVDSGGRVYVADAGLDRVEVYAPDPKSAPGPVPSFSLHCEVAGDKQADPRLLNLGEPTTVTLRVNGACPAQRTPLDIMLVVDISGSMQEPADSAGGPNKLGAAQAAAAAFAEQVDFESDRVGLVSFNQSPLLVRPLTADRTALVAGINLLAPGGGTDIAAGLEEARRELGGPRRRPAASGVIVLLTDGANNQGQPPVLAVAGKARLEGLRLITVAFGRGADVDLLGRIASGPGDAYTAADSAALSRAYRDIARRLAASVLFQQLVVNDDLPANMQLVPGTADPPAVLVGRRLTWVLGDVPLAGLVLRYQVLPQEVGVWPTNVLAFGEGRDGLDQPANVPFPIPVVTVVAPFPTAPPPTPEPSPTVLPAATAPPTGTPRPPTPARLFLPLLQRQTCPKSRRHVDVALILDTSISMQDPAPGGGTKLSGAVDAALRFVSLLDFSSSEADRAAVIAFNSVATIEQPLSSNAADLAASLAKLPSGPGTRIDLGLVRAGEALFGSAGSRRLPLAILLTDGRPTGTTDAAVVAAAASLKDQRATIFTIGLGRDVDLDLLRRVASSPAASLVAPTTAELAAIYAGIARELPCLGPDG